MAQAVAKKHSDKIKELNKIVKDSLMYFDDNINRFRRLRSFVFASNLTQSERSKLESIKKPPVEANSLAVHISKLRGEFSWQSPSFKVGASVLNPDPDIAQITFCDSKLEAIKAEADKYGFSDTVYTDQISGGYSVMKMWTDYVTPYSNNQEVYFGNVFDPTLCGFDPLARQPHKGDGSYCFECVPMNIEKLKKIYPNADVTNISYNRTPGGVNFSFKSINDDKMTLLVYLYKKKRKKIKILRLSTGHDLTEEEYKQLIKYWNDTNKLEQEPKIVSYRISHIEKICRYVFIENQVLEYIETELSGFPLVYVDGDSLILHSDNSDGQIIQFTRPAVLSAEDLQKVKNLTFQTMANHLENMSTHKMMASRESIHPNDIEAWRTPQKPSTLLYQHKDSQNDPLPIPTPLQLPPLSPEVLEIYKMMEDSIQQALGSFDPMYSNLTKQQVSGRAIVESATQNNASAMPYVINFMIALNRLGQLAVNYFPKIYTAPQLVSVMDKTGQKQIVPLNMPGQQGNITLDHKDNEFQVEVKAGVNFEIQKNQSLQVLQGLSQAFPVVSEFVNTKGLPTIMENISIRGSSQLQELANDFQAEMVQQKQQAQNNQPPPDPMMIRAQIEQDRLAFDKQNAAAKNQLEQDKLNLEQMKVGNAHAKDIVAAKLSHEELALDARKVDAENVKTMANITNAHLDRTLEGTKHILDHTHKMSQVFQNTAVLPPITGEISDENETP